MQCNQYLASNAAYSVGWIGEEIKCGDPAVIEEETSHKKGFYMHNNNAPP